MIAIFYVKKGKKLLFEKIKNELKKENEINYNKFIKNLELDDRLSDSGKLVIKAPNIYIANFLKRKYFHQIFYKVL